MYVCMYVCMHVCMYVCMYACIYIYIYIYICIYIYIERERHTSCYLFARVGRLRQRGVQVGQRLR